jgi:hypothetical protein
MLEAVTKEDFNEVYRRFKTAYTNDASILKYVEKGWTGNRSLWRLMQTQLTLWNTCGNM